jgi:Ca-activated chloride channel family protein
MVSITFERPEYLWFLLALPLLVVTHFYLLRHAKRKALAFANFSALKRALGTRYITKNYTMLAVRLLIVAVATLAVAQTVLWYESDTNENDYVITLDTSASMSAQDILPSRLEAAKAYAGRFLDALDARTRAGLVSFSGITFIEQPLTEHRGDLSSSLEEIELSASGTDIPGAIVTSVNLLASTEKGRAVILISDGSNTIETFQSKSLQRAVQYAKLNRVKVYTIGVGTPDGSPIGYLPSYYNVSASYNADNLEYIANATNATYYAARNDVELERAYADIKASDKRSTLRFDLTPGLMLIALALILVEWGLISTRFRLLP